MATNLALKAAIVARGLTQLQVAENVGVSEQCVSRCITGRMEAPDALKEDIASLLEEDKDVLFKPGG